MSAQYKLRIRSSAGILTAEITDYLDLAYTKKINGRSFLKFQLYGEHLALNELENAAHVEVWRRVPEYGLEWYKDFVGILNVQEFQHTKNGEIFTGTCADGWWLLDWRISAYHTEHEKAKFEKMLGGEMIDTLFKNNTLSPGERVKHYDTEYQGVQLLVNVSETGNETFDYDSSWSYLSDAILEIAGIAGLDLMMINLGGNVWELQVGRLGRDLSQQMLFALQHGNMASPRLIIDKSREKTVAFSGGRGTGAERDVIVRMSEDYNALDNNKEMWVDARTGSTTAAIAAIADGALAETRAKNQLSFDVLQTPATCYGQQAYCSSQAICYDVGDIVMAKYRNVTEAQRIIGVAVQISPDGSENIDLELATHHE